MAGKDMVASHDYVAEPTGHKKPKSECRNLSTRFGASARNNDYEALLPHMIVSTIKMDVNQWYVASG
jgi:hypothetical protein